MTKTKTQKQKSIPLTDELRWALEMFRSAKNKLNATPSDACGCREIRAYKEWALNAAQYLDRAAHDEGL